MESTPLSQESHRQRSQLARIAGAMYLLTVSLALFGEAYVRSSLLVGSSAARTASNLVESAALYRTGLATDLLTFAGVAVLVWALYHLVREVSHRLALLALLFRAIELAVHFSAIGFGLVALSLVGGGEYTQSFEAAQLHGLVGVALRAQLAGLGIGFIPLGFGSALFAFLLLQSGLVPRLLASWGVLASLLLAAYSFGVVLSPDASDYFYVGMLPMFIYEVSLGCWLLFRRLPPTSRSAA